MRENRTYGSEGGAARVITGRAYPYQGAKLPWALQPAEREEGPFGYP